MKKSVAVLISLILILATGCATYVSDAPVYQPNESCRLVGFKTGSEPNGFNEISWETELMRLDKMLYYRKDISHGGIDFYIKQGDTFKLKNGKSRPVQYGFWKGKFYVGMVVTQGADDWNSLKEVVFDKYGQGAKTFINRDEYIWVGRNTIMALRYDESTSAGTYYIRSSSMEKQMD